MSKQKYSIMVIMAALCFAMTPFSGIKIAGRGISLYLYALFAITATHSIYKSHGRIRIESTQWIYIFLLLYFIISYMWTPPHSGNVVVEGDYSAFINGTFFVLLLMLFKYSASGKKLFQFSSFAGALGMALYMLFSSSGTYSYQFSNRVTLAIGDSVSEANYLSFLLIVPAGYAVSRILDSKYNKAYRVFSGVSIFLFLYILLFTGSRSGILAVVATAFFAIVLTLFNSRKIKLGALAALTVFGVAIAIILPNIIDQLPTAIASRLTLQNFLFATSGANGRLDIWQRAFDALGKENNVLLLLFGHGFLSSEVTFGLTLHNLFLQVLYEQGVLGLVVICILFYRIIKDSISSHNVIIMSSIIGTLILCMSLAGVISRFFWINLSMLIICSRPNKKVKEDEYA